MFPFLAPLALLSQMGPTMAAESAGPGAGLPTLSELAAKWQTVKTCNHRGPRRRCAVANDAGADLPEPRAHRGHGLRPEPHVWMPWTTRTRLKRTW